MKIHNFFVLLIISTCVSCKTEIQVATDNVFTNSTYTSVKYKTTSTDSWITTESNYTLLIDNIHDLSKALVAKDGWGGKAGDYSSNTKFGTPGFFRVGKVGPRWAFIDPDNGMDIICGTQGVAPGTSSDFARRFTSNATWSLETGNLLVQNGFNCTCYGGTRATAMPSDIKSNLLDPGLKKLAYTEILYMLRSFMWDSPPSWYNDTRDNRLCLIFEPAFLTYIDNLAKIKCALYKDDVHFLGYLIDNELGFKSWQNSSAHDGIDINAFMSLPSTSGAYNFAQNFLAKRSKNISAVTPADFDDFRSTVADYYYQVTTSAIRKYDSNHLILGSRLHNFSKSDEVTLRACAKYCDVISINYYGKWDPDTMYMNNLRKFTDDKPFIVTEFYTKADSAYYNNVKYDNLDGGGWIVETQKDRGYFYQNFCIKLLKAQNCIGWLHFQYNDILSTVSPNYTNKGIVSPKYEPYTEFLKYVKQLNTNIYNITDYIDK